MSAKDDLIQFIQENYERYDYEFGMGAPHSLSHPEYIQLIDKLDEESYEQGYDEGLVEGERIYYNEGYEDGKHDYEKRIVR
jgi:flagellar biosynthesis/type III secretory pathway protein FliH